MSIKIDRLSVPKNCFQCFASRWYDFGGKIRGFQCKALPMDTKIISNCEGRSQRREDCPIRDVDEKIAL